MSRIQDYRYFYVACVTGVVAIILTIWGFYLGNLTEDQRAILSGFDAVLFGLSSGGFMGSLTVKSKGIVPAVVTAGGGFAVWFLVFYFMFK